MLLLGVYLLLGSVITTREDSLYQEMIYLPWPLAKHSLYISLNELALYPGILCILRNPIYDYIQGIRK